MKFEINVISKEVITPSSPTPSHLKNYKFSFLDQIAPPFLMPHVFFYPSNPGNPITESERSNRLKKSLSQALTVFFPLAGRLVSHNDDVTYVDCNDEGVVYLEARANCELTDIITDPIPEELNNFIPFDQDVAKGVFVIVQATFFKCSGLAIGIAVSHKVADAFSFFMFVNYWAKISRGDEITKSPIFESATLFPPKDLGSKKFVPPKGQKRNFVTKRFVFTAQKIADLRDKYTEIGADPSLTENEGSIRPTRIEALSAFIWTRFMVSTGAKDDATKTYALLFPVDIRTRVVPPLSEYHFGNLLLRATSVPSLENDGDSTYGVVKKIRDSIRNVDQDFVAKVREGDETWDAIKVDGKVQSGGEVVIFRSSSLCRLPLYEADFGWGKPVWVGSTKFPMGHTVLFMNSLSGDGIEAWVNLTEEDMAKFEANEELLQYVS